MKKILYISPDFFFDVDFPVLEGLSKYFKIYWIAILTKKSRYSIDRLQSFSVKNKINISIFKRTTSKASLKNINFHFKIVDHIKTLNYDILYFEYFRDFYFLIFLQFFLKHKYKIIGIHDVALHKRTDKFGLKKIFDKITFNRFQNFHFFSASQRNLFLKSYSYKNVFLIPLCLKDFGPPAVKLTNKNSTVRFLFFGTINYYKGIDILIDAAEMLVENNITNFKIVIAGEGKYWIKCSKKIKNKNFFDLRIGIVDNNDVPDLFSSIHYTVLPYRDVTQSGVLLTSYFYEKPVIAANHDEFKNYILDNFNGYIFNELNSLSLYRCLKKTIINHSKDYTKIKTNLCNFKNENFSKNKIIDDYVLMFNKILIDE